MADTDLLPPRGVPYAAVVDATGTASGGTSSAAQLAARGIRAICQVDATGLASSDGTSTVAVLASRGLLAFAAVDENGVSTDDAVSTADVIRQRGIRPMVPVNANGIAATGSATILTLAQRGLDYFCPVDESGAAVDLTPAPPNTIVARRGLFTLTGESMTTINEFVMTADNTGVTNKFTLAGQSANLVPPVGATTWDPAAIPASITLDGTKLIATSGFSVAGMVRSTTSASSGKKYFKCTPTFATGINTFGFCNASASNTSIIGIDGNSLGIVQDGTIQVSGGGFTSGGSYASGDTPEMAVDFTANLLWFRKNGGNWNGSSSNDPATGVGGISMAGHGLGSGPWFAAMFIVGSGGTQATATANFLGTPPSGFTNW